MGERKVLNKYFPPDFDPSKVPRGQRVRSEDKQMKVRMMLPMSVRCNTCGNFMYKGTKFNTRMEDVRGETYLGIKIFRFYYRCTNCSAEFCMKTDPKTTDYIVEGGATRNYEPWRETERTTEVAKAQREEEEKGNAMKALENRTLDSKREMDILTALDEMKSLKARHAALDPGAVLAALQRSVPGDEPADLDAEDEEAVRQMLLQRTGFIKRLSDSEEDEAEGGVGGGGGGAEGGGSVSGKRAGSGSSGRPGKKVRSVGGPSVAAAAWEEEGEEDAAEEGVAVREERGGDDGAGGSAPELYHGNSVGGVDGTNFEAREAHNGRHPGGEGKEDGGQRGASGGGRVEDARPPPSIPSFGAGKVGIVLKKKKQPVQQQTRVEEKGGGPQSSGEGDGGAGLLGLAAYGSGSESA